jgi:purine-binding chemotaxis protein CheW
MAVVAEVGRPPAVTRVPGLPEWVAGVANWRGRILALVDLRPLLGADQVALAGAGRLVVASHDGVTLGLLADAVDGVLRVDEETMEPPPVTLSDSAAALVRGQLVDNQGPVAVLDVVAVFRLRDGLARIRRGA